MRPIGAIVLGTHADRVGRRAALSWAIVMIALHAVCRRRHAASRVDHGG
jgi:MFS family permease